MDEEKKTMNGPKTKKIPNHSAWDFKNLRVEDRVRTGDLWNHNFFVSRFYFQSTDILLFKKLQLTLFYSKYTRLYVRLLLNDLKDISSY